MPDEATRGYPKQTEPVCARCVKPVGEQFEGLFPANKIAVLDEAIDVKVASPPTNPGKATP